jgi:hypothetical protein
VQIRCQAAIFRAAETCGVVEAQRVYGVLGWSHPQRLWTQSQPLNGPTTSVPLIETMCQRFAREKLALSYLSVRRPTRQGLYYVQSLALALTLHNLL